jgi:hypothetical protein
VNFFAAAVSLQSSGGIKDTNNTGQLSVDPAMHHVFSERTKDKTTAWTRQMGMILT